MVAPVSRLFRIARSPLGTSMRADVGPQCLSAPYGQQAPVIVVATVADTIAVSKPHFQPPNPEG
jgi:hypothetical protein